MIIIINTIFIIKNTEFIIKNIVIIIKIIISSIKNIIISIKLIKSLFILIDILKTYLLQYTYDVFFGNFFEMAIYRSDKNAAHFHRGGTNE